MERNNNTTSLIEKVVNAKYGEECGVFIADNTVRGGKLKENNFAFRGGICLLYTSPSPRDEVLSRMPSSA